MFGVATTQAPSSFYSNAVLSMKMRGTKYVSLSFARGQIDYSREPLDMGHDNSDEFDNERITFSFNTQHV